MAFTLQVAPLVQFCVSGTLRNEVGADAAFDYTLTCRRLDVAAYNAAINGKKYEEQVEALASLIAEWAGVHGADGEPVDCTPDAVRQLLGVPGMAQLVLDAYLLAANARAKN